MSKKILVSQQAPSNMAPYNMLSEKFGLEFEFKPFFLIKPLSSLEFRSQKINLADYTAAVFSSRSAIDAYFALCEELRVKVPETMKYFCTTELVAMYLQKHIVFRKRKIFYGDGTPASVAALITPRHSGEKFLIATSDNGCTDPYGSLFAAKKLDFTPAVFVKSEPQDLRGIDLESYDMVVLYNRFDLKSLYNSFPEFEQGKVKFATYGKSIVKAMEEAGLDIEVQAPTPEAPSVSKALELYYAGLVR